MRATSIQQSGTATTTSARPKPSGRRTHSGFRIGKRLADQVLACDADMNAAGIQLVHDLGGGEKHDLDAIEPLNQPAIAALVAAFAQCEACLPEESWRRHP